MYITSSLTIFLFRTGIAFYFHLFSTVQVTVRPKKKCVFMVTSAKSEIVVPGSGIRYFIFEISGQPSFVEAVL